MTLEVDGDALTAYAAALNAWSGDTGTARTYTDTHLRLGSGGSKIFLSIVAVNEDVIEALRRTLGRLGQLTHAAAGELSAAARMYDETDQDQAEKLDRTYAAVTLQRGGRYEDKDTPETNTRPKPEDEPAFEGGGAGW